MNAQRRERERMRIGANTVWPVVAKFIYDVRWSFRKKYNVEKA